MFRYPVVNKVSYTGFSLRGTALIFFFKYLFFIDVKVSLFQRSVYIIHFKNLGS
jgi:hypothetical protein